MGEVPMYIQILVVFFMFLIVLLSCFSRTRLYTGRESKFFVAKGRGPISTRAFCAFFLYEFKFGLGQGPKSGKIALAIGKYHRKQKIAKNSKMVRDTEKIPLTTRRKSGSPF